MKRLVIVAATLALAVPSAYAARGIDLDTDRARAEDAAFVVRADQRYLAFQEHRVDLVNESWRHEIARHHPQEAGILAVEHFKAMQDARAARRILNAARQDYVSAREQLIVDEFHVQRG